MHVIHRLVSSFAPVSAPRSSVAFSFVALTMLLVSPPLKAQYVDWIRQIGSSGEDGFWGVSVNPTIGTIYAVGDTEGSLFGPSLGGGDAWLVKYDSAGNLLSGKQDGTPAFERFTAASADGAGGVFVGGNTSTGLFGPPRVGTGDNVFGRIDPSNNWTWLQQSATDSVQGGGGQNTDMLITSGTVFTAVAGPYAGGGDTLFSVRNSAGSVIQQRQFGSAGFDGGNTATIDAFGNYIIAGVTTGALSGPNAGGADAYVAKYDASGTQLWVRQLGSAATDASTSIATDASGNVYVAGITDGAIGGPNAGSSDAFVAKYDATGFQQWVKQFGTAASDGNPLVTNTLGSVWLSTSTLGSLFGPNLGNLDVAAAKLDAGSGNVLWSTQIGTANAEHALAITADATAGRVYIAGLTNGSFGGPHVGFDDAMLIAINAIPEPASMMLLVCGAAIVAAWRRVRESR